MITSILDNDFYKFTMMHAVSELYPDAEVVYEFVNRNSGQKFTIEFLDLIKERIHNLDNIHLTQIEYDYLKTLKIFPDYFLSLLKDFRFDSSQVDCKISPEGELHITLQGRWQNTILYEVPILAIISETYFETVEKDWNHNTEDYFKKTLAKGEELSQAGARFTDFGTRRRRSYSIQRAVIEAFASIPKDHSTYIGTSNVHFSRLFNTPPIGTMAHEWIMGHAGMIGIEKANECAMSAWFKTFGTDLSIALTDTYTSTLFFKQFTPELAKQFSGIRQDSGDPIEFIDHAVAFYKDNNIDPTQKKIVFSDSLDTERAIKIHNYAKDKVLPLFGIGTFFTNDFASSKSLNIVMKLFSINGKEVAKTTDDLDKATGWESAVNEAIKTVKALSSS